VTNLLSKARFVGRVEKLMASARREDGLAKSEVAELLLQFSGIAGDCHAGLSRPSDSRMTKLYARNTEVRNARQVSIVSAEELAAVAKAMELAALDAGWVGANILTSGIPELTLLPPSTRLQFPSGAVIVIDMENLPCRYAAEEIERHATPQTGFVTAAKEKRGLVGWVEREGTITKGDSIGVWVPPQRFYRHA
jgi:hypothetical protein